MGGMFKGHCVYVVYISCGCPHVMDPMLLDSH